MRERDRESVREYESVGERESMRARERERGETHLSGSAASRVWRELGRRRGRIQKGLREEARGFREVKLKFKWQDAVPFTRDGVDPVEDQM